MKRLLSIALLSAVPLLIAGKASAQIIKDPTSWSYEVKKKSGNQYDLIFHMKLEKPFHIWSLKPGGDGYQVAPSFVFDKNANLKLDGVVRETGKKTTGKMDGVDGTVSYFSGNVDYVQTVTVTGKGKITGKQEYQVCNDKLCLPPKKKSFEFEIK